MKKINLCIMAAAGIALSSCSKLGNLGADNFTVTPTPLEAIGGEVPATINGVFPVKYMKKKAVVTVTPVLKYDVKEALGQPATFQGEKVEENNTTVSYKLGGAYTMKTTFAYESGMEQSDLYARFDARLGKKKVSIPEVKIGYGVVATSDLLGRCTGSASTAPDAFQRVIEQKHEANIKFLIGQANLRASELSSVSIQDLVKILKEINDKQEERALQGIEVSAYASPDGSYGINEKLAERRQDVSADYVRKQMKKAKVDGDVSVRYTAEDWDGFQELVSKSNLQDKDLILRVLSMYQDPEEREQQIRNMSSVYTEIASGIMPELRRARLMVNYEVIGRSDDQILQQYQDDPTKLSVEELLYGANELVDDDATRRQWYETTTRQYPNDYRAYNNLAKMAVEDGDIASAKAYLAKAKAVDAKAPEANANMALISLKEGDKAAAQTYISQASGSNTFDDIMGQINIANGNYTAAASNLQKSNTNAAALAQILSKDYASASRTLANVRKPDATTSYLKAIVGARTGDSAAVRSNLQSAISQDATLAGRAAKDLEFSNYKSVVEALVK